mmetsp:Transcript_46303/g.100688  ORF Transcript_46303/g.100688 Transcript_46303/m.100688 type:complete len:82 (-) Transcript_46303:157-402(-)|eukprot:CAMPEP_0170574664 /NCGR_PEP_ID=MMETSP0224-20130122/3426_1 /TAXON_ID=285029 /ORGANISM="Togula jolla, Strain CCCM 725" /LENGTH=81 /DNA_ID=CAMNT_0010897347 /DNA_START=103 /DNA_END=348 /DNA_ORIENTATION=-
MGNFVSRGEAVLQSPKIKKAKVRMSKLAATTWWLGGHVAWIGVTGFIVLGMPIFFEYERECQLFEQMAQMQSAQMNAPLPA